VAHRSDGAEFLIVGAGAAGCVLATRLAQAGRSVVLLEAGPDLRASGAELRAGWTLPKPPDWGFESEADAAGNTEPLRRGRGVGGSSWLTRFAVRGAAADFDAWAAAGNVGWSFDELLPSFRQLESDLDFGDRPWHGASGPIPITRYPEHGLADIHAASVEAAIAVGFEAVDDHNAPAAVGIGRIPMSSRSGVRASTADAYLPLAPAGYLSMRSDSPVAKVEVERGRAIGVRLADGTSIPSERVILASGTYGSPAILMRSGVGPAQHLRELGIPVLVDLAGVGANLADHPSVDVTTDWQGVARDAPLLHSMATFRSESAEASDPPDLMLWTTDPRGDPASFEIDALLLKPRSRGRVRLRSADPAAAPRIELPGLSDARDVARLSEAYRRGWDVMNGDALRRRGARPSSPLPGIDGELRSYVASNSYSVPHVVGTCAMGPAGDAGAVVNAAARVHGVDGLYVVDASIIPQPTAGFPHIITIALAETIAARMIAGS